MMAHILGIALTGAGLFLAADRIDDPFIIIIAGYTIGYIWASIEL